MKLITDPLNCVTFEISPIVLKTLNYTAYQTIPTQVCQQDFVDKRHAWSPCDRYMDGNYWLEVTFNRSVVPAAVVLYIGSDGKREYSHLEKTVKVELIDNSGRVYQSGGDETKLSCKTNPAVIPVHHDMTQPFFYVRKVRISFKSYLIGVAGVALRSRAQFDVVEMSKCGPDEIFSPRTQHCHKYLCERPSCPELAVKHAAVKCEGTEEGQTCTVACKPGYRPFKTFKMICLNKEWQGINKACVPVNCGVPRIPNGKAGKCNLQYSCLQSIPFKKGAVGARFYFPFQ